MSAIFGIVTRDAQGPTRRVLQRMGEALLDRGTDTPGLCVRGPAGLGSLSTRVTEHERAQQPFSSEDGTAHAVIDGHLHHCDELKSELMRRGHQFATPADSEVIVHGYEEYGEDCLHRLHGAFAFAIWDGRSQRLLLGRDRLGIKPLHYAVIGDRLIFASEMRALVQAGLSPELDCQATDSYLTFEYVPGEQTILRGVKRLPPGHLLTWHQGQTATRQYWDLRAWFEGPAPSTATETEAARTVAQLLQEAVERALRADVPVGVLLSGGIDSSAIVALASRAGSRPLPTFSLGFEEQSYNELTSARSVAARFSADHHEFVLGSEVAELVEELAEQMDEPLADSSLLPTFFISKMARREVKVLLSGDGGDEVFAGYHTYLAQRLAGYYEKLPHALRHGVIAPLLARLPSSRQKRGLLNSAKRFLEGEALPRALQHCRWMAFLSQAEKQRLYSDAFREQLGGHRAEAQIEALFDAVADLNDLSQQQYVDMKTYLADAVLAKAEGMSAVNSLEVRVPFLDEKLVEFVLALPPELRLRRLRTKHILRKALSGLLPVDILRRPKEGFSSPIKSWLRGSLKPLMLELLSEQRVRRRGLFNPARVGELIEEHLAGRANHSHVLWAMMVLESWTQRWIGRA